MSPAQGYRRFLLFFYTANHGINEDGSAFAAKGPGCACALFGPELGLLCAFGAERIGRAGDGFVGLVAYLFWPGAWLALRFGVKRVGLAGGVSMGGGCRHWQRIFFLLCCRGAKQPAARFSGACIFLYNHRLAPGLYTGLLFPYLFPAFCKKQTQTPKPKRKYLCFSGWLIAF